jgi:hypothetical protein
MQQQQQQQHGTAVKIVEVHHVRFFTSYKNSKLKLLKTNAAVRFIDYFNNSNFSKLGTALQIGRSLVRFQMVSLEFFFDMIPPVALWPWGRLSL